MEQAILFSAVEGEVRQGGQALPGATLIREWDFAENKVRGRDEARTDARGRFAFPQVTHPYKRPRILAQQTVIAQLIRVKSGTGEWRVWETIKYDLKPGTEPDLAGAASATPLRVTIDLDSPETHRGEIFGHTLLEGSK